LLDDLAPSGAKDGDVIGFDGEKWVPVSLGDSGLRRIKRLEQEDQILLERIDSMEIALGDAKAGINEKVTLLVSKTEALARRDTELSAALGKLRSSVQITEEARVTETKATASRIESVISTLTDVKGQVIGQAKASTQLKTEVQVINGKILAQAQRITELEATTTTSDLADIEARVTTIEGAYVSEADLTAVADRVTTIEGQINTPTTGILARITTVESSKANGSDLTAAVSRISTLESQVNTPTTGILARITTVESTKADGTALTAVSDRVTTLETQVNTPTTGILARISTVESSKADATALTAVANRTTTLETAVGATGDAASPTGSIYARIKDEQNVRSAADSGFASSISTLTAAVGTKAKISVQGTAPSSPATNDLWLDTSDNNKYKFWDGSAWQYKQDQVLAALVTTEASARASADGNLASKYTLKVIAGNVVTGMNITSSTDGGTDVSDITFQASSFKVHNGSTGVAPFQVVGGTVRITGSLVIQQGDVSGLTSDLSAKANADMSNVTTIDGGKITTGTILANRLSITNLADISGTLVIGSGLGETRVENGKLKQGRFTTEVIGGASTRTTWNSPSGYFFVEAYDASVPVIITAKRGDLSTSSYWNSEGIIYTDRLLISNRMEKLSFDGWTPGLFDGDNTIYFKWDGFNLKVKVDASEMTITTT
jgi:hypothetical protein